jgi:hypothetical protein
LQDASAAAVTKHVHSDAADSDFIVSCDSGPIAADYAAETASGVPLTDPYAVQRGADKGLISLMSQGGVRARRYIIPHHLIRAIVRVQYDQDLGLSFYQPLKAKCGSRPGLDGPKSHRSARPGV